VNPRGKGKAGFALAVAALAAYVAAGVALVALGVWSGAEPGQRRTLTGIAGGRTVFLAVAAVLFLAGLGLILARLILARLAAVCLAPLARLAADIRLIASVNPGHRADLRGPAELADLAAAVNELAGRYQNAEQDAAGRAAAAGAQAAAERNFLAALMSELTPAVVVCNAEGAILLYNTAARELLDPDRHGYVGLGRSVFGVVDRESVTRCLDRVRAGAVPPRLAVARADRVLGLRVAPAAAGGDLGGFVLTLEDMTAAAEAGAARDALLRRLVESSRASLGTARAAVESVLDQPDADADGGRRRRLAEIVRDETRRLGEALDRAVADSARRTHPWSAEDVLGADVPEAAGRGVRAAAGPDVSVDEPGGRPEFYDFELFRAAQDGAGAEGTPWRRRRLDRLTCTVFDTETTGLDPSRGDKIVAIGAVRIVNGRLLRRETYEQLVDPGRRVSAASRRVHGITDEMLAGRPRIGAVLPAFARFADGSVLVGHNVAFDLKFLRLEQAAAGVAFGHPVLDTLLLSPVVDSDHADHSLDAIAGRLGIDVLGRHTALGDAILTGEIFVRLVALLVARGITTLGEAQDAARKTRRARLGDAPC
jgi:DNA polymerase III epsilon subunit family exonuclease